MIRYITLASTGLVSIVGVSGTASAQSAPAYHCAQLIAATEYRRQIPRGLLMAIAITESGFDGSPNPYAMNIAGRSYHASGTQEMANIITANWQRGEKSIDVGCMQINLKYHGQKFRYLTDLLDSTTNVEYGASYLIQLATKRGSWREGVMDYHNKKNPGRRNWYGCKVWNNYLRIIHASTGYVPCARTPTGSSVASNARGNNYKPLVIPGYNDTRQQHASNPPSTTVASRPNTGTIGGQPLISNNQVASSPPHAVTYGQIPSGHPLDATVANSPSMVVPEQISDTLPYDVEQPRQRVMGTIEIADASDDLASITTSADPRSSAFRSVRPVDWTSRVQAEANVQEATSTSSTHGGFARSGPQAQ